MVRAACLDLLLHILLEHALGHLPSSGSAWWALGVCVMVKRVSEMSERKVSKSKCCLPPSSSSSSPSSMGTTLQKSWLHHFSVGLQISSSCMRQSKGARWAPLMGRVHAWLPSCSPWQLLTMFITPKLHTWHVGASRRVDLASQVLGIPHHWARHALGLSSALLPGCPVQGSTLHPTFPPSSPFPSGLTCFGLETSPSRADFRSWKEKTACVTTQPGRA